MLRMRAFALPLVILAIAASPVQAREIVTWVVTEQWVEVSPGSARAIPAVNEVESRAIAAYGPFRILDHRRAALIDVTDSASPVQFAAMLRDYPALATLELVECPGTEDDRANLELGRMIRGAGIATHVPRGGSVRSGAVELFLAGAQRRIDDGAEFAVHSWMDEDGREARDFAAGAAVHRPYIAYYREMGMSEHEAERFYALTNSMGFGDAKWLDASEMRRWLGDDSEPAGDFAPQLAYLDLSLALP